MANSAARFSLRSTASSLLGLSLGVRLAIGFALVALLFLVANYLSQRNAASVTKRINDSTTVSRQYERISRSITDALGEYQNAILGIDAASISPKAKQSLRDAEASLQNAVKEYQALTVTLEGSVPPESVTAGVDELLRQGRALVNDAMRADIPLNTYWNNFDQLQQALSSSESGWLFGDRLAAKKATATLLESLLALRRAASAYFASPSAQRTAEVTREERAFLAALDRGAEVLIKSKNAEWIQKLRSDFESLRKTLRNIGSRRDRIEKGIVGVNLRIQEVTALTQTGIREPAAKALINTALTAAEVARETNGQMQYASIAILALIVLIAVFTVTSVTRPIKRLREATLRLASGDESARAVRGGMNELDQLAGAFNEMADRLAEAQHAMRSDQARLEERVVERTQQLRHLAYHDTLTQMPNRRHLFQHLTALLDKVRGSRRRVALLLLDLDNFKMLNDSLGHLFGDRVLKAVSERLMNAIGQNGFAARLGGDEFTVVCELGVDAAHQAEALLQEFQKPLQVDDREIIVSVSLGAGIYPDHALDAESLLRAADAALFQAKALGRNRACIASAELVEQIGGQFKTEQALRRAANFNELVLLFQPQLNLSTGTVNCVEALIRWKRGETHVSPMDFLPLAEQSGLIGEITDWVLKEAIGTLAKWRSGPWPQARIAVNISAQQLMDQAFVHKVQSLLLLHNVPPSSLELELTETALQSGSATVNTLRELRKLGVGIALDDFGAGYSSLASLEQLELSRVKIDRSLIDHVDVQPRSSSIARSIIELCRSLNLDVTVEGIERREQFQFLRQCQLVDVQGFLFAPPLSAAEVLNSRTEIPERLQILLAEDDSELQTQSKNGASVIRFRVPPRTAS